MSRPVTWDTLPSIEVWPKKTFMGLDKNSAHCFTLPKEVTQRMIDHFDLTSENLQRSLVFVIDGVDFEAEIRLANMNRSKTRKRSPEEIPYRMIVQFQWKKFAETQDEFRLMLGDEYNSIVDGGTSSGCSVIFHHTRLNRFHVELNHPNDKSFEVRIR